MDVECEGGVCRRVPRGLRMATLEAGPDAATLEWTPRTGFARFEVQIRDGPAESDPEAGWRTLSDKLSAPVMRKKNLEPATAYTFRVRGLPAGPDAEWSSFSPPFQVVTAPGPISPAPKLESFFAQGDGNFAAQISWPATPDAVAYELQTRRMNAASLEWATISDQLKGTVVRKKNLPPATDHLFRVRARVGDAWAPWSQVSAPSSTGAVNPSFKMLLGSKLLRGGKEVSVDELAGKVVAIYFSAHWCPPCRQQTANLKATYPPIHAKGLPFEIVFISADRDQAGFNEYFSEMPWLALPYSGNREGIMSMYQVSGIPKLMVFSPSGQLITDNAVGVPLSEQLIQSWMAHK